VNHTLTALNSAPTCASRYAAATDDARSSTLRSASGRSFPHSYMLAARARSGQARQSRGDGICVTTGSPSLSRTGGLRGRRGEGRTEGSPPSTPVETTSSAIGSFASNMGDEIVSPPFSADTPGRSATRPLNQAPTVRSSSGQYTLFLPGPLRPAFHSYRGKASHPRTGRYRLFPFFPML
jgi:hypothetical protein